jgi:dGTPase
MEDMRAERLHEELKKKDQRSHGQRDRDRLLYSSAFNRLSNVTQVACPHEGYIFHNRLTHSLKVAQIARRIAEILNKTESELVKTYGGLDPDVVEAAALAHDLGHPPFGHIAEDELNKLCIKYGAKDGFEGNAQSFRVVAKIESNRSEYDGLNLSRATLNAILKYPWLKDVNNSGDTRDNKIRNNKYGAYFTENDSFEFARQGSVSREGEKSLEAAIMDYADNIAYSIHDFDDFYRAGLIPVDFLSSSMDEFDGFLEKWKLSNPLVESEIENNKEQFIDLLESVRLEKQYVGYKSQRAELHKRMSILIQKFVTTIKIRPIDGEGEIIQSDKGSYWRLEFLQRVVREYVINNSQLATQQHGQRNIIRFLFDSFCDAISNNNKDLVPPRFQENITNHENDRAIIARSAADIVSSLSDKQAVTMFHRLFGIDTGSITDFLHD